MRDNWNRATPELQLTRQEIEALIDPAFAGARVVESGLAEGGLANTNIWVRLGGRDHRVVVRIFVRDPGQAEKEYRLSALVAGRVPSAPVLHYAPENPVTGHPYMIMELVEGQRLETLTASRSPAEIREIGLSVGEALAHIHSFEFADSGFLDGALNVSVPMEMGSGGLIEYARKCLIEDVGGERLGGPLTGEVMRFIEEEARLLDQWHGAPCLAHADFGGSNILIDRRQTGWQVAAVLDWEFAFSGTPFFDLGNLLRKPLGVLDGFEGAVFAGYTAGGGTLPASWRRMSLLTDLTAWMEFLTRPNTGPELIADARSVVARTIERWDSAGDVKMLPAAEA